MRTRVPDTTNLGKTSQKPHARHRLGMFVAAGDINQGLRIWMARMDASSLPSEVVLEGDLHRTVVILKLPAENRFSIIVPQTSVQNAASLEKLSLIRSRRGRSETALKRG